MWLPIAAVSETHKQTTAAYFYKGKKQLLVSELELVQDSGKGGKTNNNTTHSNNNNNDNIFVKR